VQECVRSKWPDQNLQQKCVHSTTALPCSAWGMRKRQTKAHSGASCIVQDVTRTFLFLQFGCLDVLNRIYSSPMLRNALWGL
jgi:hypothetical protein